MNESMEILRIYLPEKDRQQASILSAGAIALGFRQDDPVHLYLQEIGHLEILPEAEEQELAKQAAQGNEAARERLLDHNYLRVAAIAREYVYRGIFSLDLLLEGNKALEQAAQSYDPDSIYPFNAYASWRIRQALVHSLNDFTCCPRVSAAPVSGPKPPDEDSIRNPAMLRWLLERHNGRLIAEQDWMILAARFCPWGHRPMTPEQLEAMTGIPQEEIRKAEERTVRGRQLLRAEKLRDFYD